MENTTLRNKIVPWQGKGRWYKAVIKTIATTSSGSTTYSWGLDADKSDDIFSATSVTGKIQFVASGNTTATIYNRTGKSIRIKEVHKEIGECSSTQNLQALTVTNNQSLISNFMPNGSSQNFYLGLTASSSTDSYGTKIIVYFFVE